MIHDVAIIGGGIVGAACASACARRGLKVLVLEGGPIGGGSTAACMGHVVVMDDSPSQLAMTTYSRRLWRNLSTELPADAEYDPCGTIWVAADDEEMAEVDRKHVTYGQSDVTSEVLTSESLYDIEPNLRPGLAGGLLVHNDCIVYPPVVARFLLHQAVDLGADVRTGVRVRQLHNEGRLELDNGESISAKTVINAAGCGSPDLAPDLPVRPRKGHLAITDRYAGFVRHQLIELGYLKSAHSTQTDSVAFNIQPRKSGQMLIGSSRQFDAEDADVELEIVGRMLRRATGYLPRLGELSVIRVWAGHRAATPDKLPLIGPSTASDRIWLATGHEGLGITTSPATGELIADMLAGRAPDIQPAPYLPERFLC